MTLPAAGVPVVPVGSDLQIDDIRFRGYRWPRPKPISNGRYTYDTASTCVLEVVANDGTTGLGLSADTNVPGGIEIFQAIAESYRMRLVGRDPLGVEQLWNDMWQPKLLDRRGVATRVLSAIDIALWDLKGKLLGLPLHRLLGGFSARATTYVAGGYYEEGKGLAELADEMRENVAMGARAVKMKIGRLSLRRDAERVEAVRQAVGDDVKLLVDCNGAYTAAEAVQVARALEHLDVFWFEEPVRPDDYRGLRFVAAGTSVPVAAGENEYTRYGFRDMIEAGGVAILNPDAQILGGITEFMKVTALAQAHDLPIAPHGNQDIHVHLVTAISNGLMVEYYRDSVDPMWGRFLRRHLTLEDGYVRPPDLPGLGIEVDDESVSSYRVA